MTMPDRVTLEALPDTSRQVQTLVRAERLLTLVEENPGIPTASILDSLGITRAQLMNVKRFMDSPFENPNARTIRYDVGGRHTGEEGWYATSEEYHRLFVAHEEHVEAVIGGLAESLQRNRTRASAADWTALERKAHGERVRRFIQADQILMLKAAGFSKSERLALLAEIPAGAERLSRRERRRLLGRVQR